MTGEGRALLSVHKEANFCDLGQLACRVPQMESTVRVSVSRPEGWLATKLLVRLTTASCGPSCCAAGEAEV